MLRHLLGISDDTMEYQSTFQALPGLPGADSSLSDLSQAFTALTAKALTFCPCKVYQQDDPCAALFSIRA